MSRMPRAQALERLRRHLAAAGTEPPGRLPPERLLAPQIGCSRATLRACLADLEAEGLLWRHVGQGTFLGRPPPAASLRSPLTVEAASPHDLIAARLLIEPQIAAAAACAADAEQVAFLYARVRAGRVARDTQACEQADAAFHAAVGRASGNPVLVGFMGFLAGARSRAAWQRAWGSTYRRIGEDEFRGEHSDQHEAVVDAISARDPDGARAAMAAHLEVIRRAMLG
ncbi:FadR/GntR family transcriptional regulator [Arenibaculum pallidiluteum]|uniref:FadR/GntR family transcriptional regulator n=1 Tax=Arenibaculum pallidiluteum TaxID=2812559 RepID=UPI001A97A6CE|nr:FCD domain-containing protein [Arenibaculum pallidiluteum]